MKNEPQQYVVTIPEEFAGEVMGKLSVIGATLENCDKENGLLAINATSMKNVMENFKYWLSETTSGQGVVQEQKIKGQRGR